MAKTVFFLGGEVPANDQAAETTLRNALQDQDTVFVSNNEIFKDAEDPSKPGGARIRLWTLEQHVHAVPTGREIFVIGRSSGGQVATLLAERCKVTGVVCLSYPFKHPRHVIEPERFAHLATLTTPALIVQGTQDVFGGLELTENYQLSATVRVRFFDGGHEFDLSVPPGEDIVREVEDFIKDGWRENAKILDGFDEAFYLQTNSDVAQAVAAGALQSGRLHFQRNGRRERRKFRLLPKTAHPPILADAAIETIEDNTRTAKSATVKAKSQAHGAAKAK